MVDFNAERPGAGGVPNGAAPVGQLGLLNGFPCKEKQIFVFNFLFDTFTEKKLFDKNRKKSKLTHIGFNHFFRDITSFKTISFYKILQI